MYSCGSVADVFVERRRNYSTTLKTTREIFFIHDNLSLENSKHRTR